MQLSHSILILFLVTQTHQQQHQHQHLSQSKSGSPASYKVKSWLEEKIQIQKSDKGAGSDNRGAKSGLHSARKGVIAMMMMCTSAHPAPPWGHGHPYWPAWGHRVHLQQHGGVAEKKA